VSFDPEARERYSDVYERLSAPQPGMFGAATGRSEAHTIRLALNYALLDSSPTITRQHLDLDDLRHRHVSHVKPQQGQGLDTTRST
jgi:hypothetical protein